MTDPTAVPINMYENDRELMVMAPMPGIDPTDISVEVTDDGSLTVSARQHGEGQERIAYLLREWAYGPYRRTIELPRKVDARRANLSYGNGVLAITFPKTEAMVAAAVGLERSGHTRGIALGHPGTRGGAPAD